jgi:hypothetical protein
LFKFVIPDFINTSLNATKTLFDEWSTTWFLMNSWFAFLMMELWRMLSQVWTIWHYLIMTINLSLLYLCLVPTKHHN